MFGWGMFGKSGGYAAIYQTKTIQISSYSHSVTIYNIWPVNSFTKLLSKSLSIRFRQTLSAPNFPTILMVIRSQSVIGNCMACLTYVI